MAWYEVKYTCGCTRKINLYGKREERDKRLENENKKICFECQKQKMTEEAKKKTEERELPDLSGTEKQTNWALQIRMKFIEEFEEAVEKTEKNQKAYDLLEWILENKTTSVFWINRRYDDWLKITRSVKDEFEKTKK